MLQRKKLQYYGRQYGIENYAVITLTDEDCERICKAVGVPVVKAADIGGKFDELISIVMDDPGFIEAHRHEGVSDEVFLINSDGIIIRIRAKEVSVLGRATQGVKIMKAEGDTKIVAMAMNTRLS